MKSKATLPQLKYDNCKDCASKCEHAGKNREFVYSGERSCKVNGIARKIDREKWEPCEFCGYTEYPEKKLYPKDGYLFYAGYTKQYAVDSFHEEETEDVKFCPRCGRPLTEEAWAELERRVCGEV